jgi:nucleoside-diphosphate-sugar epimerase
MTVRDRDRVLLTGATGFVGRQVLWALLDRGCQVRAVVRSGKRERLPGESDALEIVETEDLFNEPPEAMAALVDGIDTVVHVAWYTEPGAYLLSPLNLDCLRGTLELARAFTGTGGRRFVGVGTCFEYDLSVGYLEVTTPLLPTTPYAACKAAAYFSLSTYFETVGVEFAWCRLFYLYGEGEDERRLVPYLRARLSAGEPAELSSGTQVRDFLDVRAAGDMVAGVATGTEVGAFNICSGVPVTVRALAERIADEYGGRHLLAWGARPGNVFEPPVVVGIREVPGPLRHESRI